MLEVEYAIAAILILLIVSILAFVFWGLFHEQIKDWFLIKFLRCNELLDNILDWWMDLICGKLLNR